MQVKTSSDRTAAVDIDYEFQPMASCPRGVKVQLLTKHGVAVYGSVGSSRDGFVGWAPCPKVPKWAKELM
jgi:hypothetical protein